MKKLESENLDFFAAARNGDVEFVLKKIDSGFNIEEKNLNGHTVLMIAAYNGHYDLSKVLIEKGADINSVDEKLNSIIMGVVFKGHSAIFDLFVSHNCNLSHTNLKGQTALDLAIMFGKRDLIFKINQKLKSNRSSGRLEQVKTWINYVAN